MRAVSRTVAMGIQASRTQQCVIANFSMCRPKDPLTIDDFTRRGKPDLSDAEIEADIAAKFQILAVKPGAPLANHLIR
jgi:hypothetical protein